MISEEKKRNTPTNYHTYGAKTHSEIAQELGISTSLSHKIESDLMMKFALAIFNPPWAVKHENLRHLKDAAGNMVKFESVGEYSNLLEEVVRAVLSSQNERTFRREYEQRIVDISKNVYFRKFVMSMFFVDDEEESNPDPEYPLVNKPELVEQQQLNFISQRKLLG